MKQFFPDFFDMSKMMQSKGLIAEHIFGHRNKESAFWYTHQLLKEGGVFLNDSVLRNLTATSETPEHVERLMANYFRIRQSDNLFGFLACKSFLKYRSMQGGNRTKLIKSDSYFKKQAEVLTGKYCNETKCSITVDDVLALYEICGFQLLFNKNDSFCWDWPIKLLQKLAYATDVMKYYDSSYGTGYAENLGCGLSRVIIEEMQSALKGWTPSHMVRMVIQETLLPLVTIGKVFPPDNRLNWTSIPDENWERTFRMNELSPMTANVQFLLYDCSSCRNESVETVRNEDYRVLTVLNERVVKTPYNATQHLISFEDFKKNFQPCSEEEMKSKCGEN